MAGTDLPDLWVFGDDFCHHNSHKRDWNMIIFFFTFKIFTFFLCTGEMTVHSLEDRRETHSSNKLKRNGKSMGWRHVWMHILPGEMKLHRKVGMFVKFPAQIVPAELTHGFWTCNNLHVSMPGAFARATVSSAALNDPPGPSLEGRVDADTQETTCEMWPGTSK